MRRAPLALTAALLAALAACATPPAAGPPPEVSAPQAEPAPPGDAAPPSAAPDLDALPEVIRSAPSAADRVFRCLAWPLTELEGAPAPTTREEAMARLREVKAARSACVSSIHEQFQGFEVMLRAVDEEWLFWVTYHALTAEGFTPHNHQTVCANLRQTFRASRRAVDALANYSRWLDAQIRRSTRTDQDPVLNEFLEQARGRHDALRQRSTALGDQYFQACQRP